jgi:hypothetical protein
MCFVSQGKAKEISSRCYTHMPNEMPKAVDLHTPICQAVCAS